MHPSSSRAFQRDQVHDVKHPGSVDLISTNKTNKLPSFIDRWSPCVTSCHARWSILCLEWTWSEENLKLVEHGNFMWAYSIVEAHSKLEAAGYKILNWLYNIYFLLIIWICCASEHIISSGWITYHLHIDYLFQCIKFSIGICGVGGLVALRARQLLDEEWKGQSAIFLLAHNATSSIYRPVLTSIVLGKQTDI
jgi:hypothetical protein